MRTLTLWSLLVRLVLRKGWLYDRVLYFCWLLFVFLSIRMWPSYVDHEILSAVGGSATRQWINKRREIKIIINREMQLWSSKRFPSNLALRFQRNQRNWHNLKRTFNKSQQRNVQRGGGRSWHNPMIALLESITSRQINIKKQSDMMNIWAQSTSFGSSCLYRV